MSSHYPRAMRYGPGRAFTVRYLLLAALISVVSCGDDDLGVVEPSFVSGEVAVVPRPRSVWVDADGSVFVLGARTPVLAEGGNGGAELAAEVLVELLNSAFPGRPAAGVQDGAGGRQGTIVLTSVGADAELGEEGYELVVESSGVVVRSVGGRGLLHGVQSLRQMLPIEVESGNAVGETDWSVPSVRVIDRPRFPWRGLMLDSSRFFVPFEYVLRTIDVLALLKMSVLHLHLSDDQGWRIESERYPELHTIGSQWDAELAAGERGGYYTRAELEDIVAYAQRVGVEVVPEVDVPGHSLAILRALPHLACTSSPDAVRERDEFRLTLWAEGPFIHEEVLCACDERVYEFVADVLDELVAIFPGRWIHLGGDETPIAEWETSHLCGELVANGEIDGPDEVQAYFSRRVEELVRERGRRMVGWSEVLRNEQMSHERFALSDSFVTMRWDSLFAGDPPRIYDRDVVQSPLFTLYLDWYNSTSLEEVYAYEPVPDGLTLEEAAHVLGAQGNMWTGFPQQRSLERLDIHIYPKLLAIAELTWSAPERREFSDFESRRVAQEPRLGRLGVTLGTCEDCQF